MLSVQFKSGDKMNRRPMGLRASSARAGLSTAGMTLCAVAVLSACGGGGGGEPVPVTPPVVVVTPTSAPAVAVKSSLPYRVSGGSALVEIVMPTDIKSGETLAVTVNGTDVSAVFKDGTTAGTKIGLVTGLKDGDNALSAKVGSSAASALTLTNYPIAGPISSGPQVTPFICQTSTLALPDITDCP